MTVQQPGTLSKNHLFRMPSGDKTLVVKGELNDADMAALRDWIQTDPNRKNLETADLSGVSGISRIPSKMFFCCRKLREVILPSEPVCLGSQAFAYTSELSFINTEQITEIDTFDCFAFCGNLPEMSFSEMETAGSFTFRKSEFKGSVSFPKLKSLSSYIFKDAVIRGNLSFSGVTCCREDAFFGITVLGTIDLPNCVEMKYGVFNEIRSVHSLRLTTDRSILLNPHSFTEYSVMKNTVLYLHPNKKSSIRDKFWGGVLWKEIRFSDD